MRRIDLLTLPTSPTLTPPAAGRAVYGLSVGRDIRLFSTFAEFSSELALALSGGGRALSLSANGSYDSAAATLHATHIAVQFAAD
jgi:hypothetical protein